jgi:NADH pyrophosphatase NudC (nudix superfamily)
MSVIFALYLFMMQSVCHRAYKLPSYGRLSSHRMHTLPTAESSSAPLIRESMNNDKYLSILQLNSTRFIPVSSGNSFFAMKSPDIKADEIQPIILTTADLSLSDSIALDSASARVDMKALYSTFYYLGSVDQEHYLALNLNSSLYQDKALPYPDRLLDKSIAMGNLRNYAGLLEESILGKLVHARGLAVWHDSCQHCSRCGAKTNAHRYGATRKCSNAACATTHYPRIEPSVIMLIMHSSLKYCLLGRKKQWVKGRYSTLAGFVDVGESLEEAVIREVKEESNVSVSISSLKYVASQSWPYPASLMVGFMGFATGNTTSLPEIAFDQEELEDCKWIPIEEVREAYDRSSNFNLLFEASDTNTTNPIQIPPKYSLAYRLIKEYVLNYTPESKNKGE